MPRTVHREHGEEIVVGQHRERVASHSQHMRSRQRTLEIEGEGETAVGEAPVQLDEVGTTTEWRVAEPGEQRALLALRMSAARWQPEGEERRARVGVAGEWYDQVEIDRLPKRDVAIELKREHGPLVRKRGDAGAAR